jgi:hypothetical protein
MKMKMNESQHTILYHEKKKKERKRKRNQGNKPVENQVQM